MVLKFSDLGACSPGSDRNVAADAGADGKDTVLWENVLAQAELSATPLSGGMERERFLR